MDPILPLGSSHLSADPSGSDPRSLRDGHRIRPIWDPTRRVAIILHFRKFPETAIPHLRRIAVFPSANNASVSFPALLVVNLLRGNSSALTKRADDARGRGSCWRDTGISTQTVVYQPCSIGHATLTRGVGPLAVHELTG